MMLGHDGLAGLKAYSTVHTYPQSATRLDANEMGFELPFEVRSEIANEIATLAWNRYPDTRAHALREAIGAFIKAPPSSLVLGSGSDELIAMLSTAFTRPRSASSRAVVLYPEPTFVMYGITGKAHHLETVGVPLDASWQLDIDAIMRAVTTRQPNLIYFASPNNPTGNLFDEHVLEQVIEHAKDSLVVIDEAYVAFAERSLGEWVDRYPNVVVLGTLSKIGLAALRVGWARLSPALLSELEKVRQPYNLNAVSQYIATRVLTKYQGLLERCVQNTKSEREVLAKKLSLQTTWKVFPSDANFLLTRVPDAEKICLTLRSHNIWVRKFESHPRLSDCLRITVGTRDENETLMAALKSLA
jgi:histidinol-phosphate aminotransferase